MTEKNKVPPKKTVDEKLKKEWAPLKEKDEIEEDWAPLKEPDEEVDSNSNSDSEQK